MSSLTRIPAGVQYFFDDEARRRRYVERRVMEVIAGWSYDEILLPIFDYHDLFSRGMGAEKAEQTYRFIDREGALLALRPEMTSLVARTVATRFASRPRPLRLCYSGDVFRYDEQSRRGAREFHQLGLEHIGGAGIVAEVEVLLIAVELLTALAVGDFRITLTHVDFFRGLAADLGLDEAGVAELGHSIDRRNGAEIERFLARHAHGMAAEWRTGLRNLIGCEGSSFREGAWPELTTSALGAQAREALAHLAEIHGTLRALGLDHHFAIDLGEMADLDYYTGLIFKVYVPNWGSEIGSGGRYDRLIGNFGRDEAAVGFSFSLDGLAGAIAHQNAGEPWRRDEADETAEMSGTAGGGTGGESMATAFARALELRQMKKRVKIGEK